MEAVILAGGFGTRLRPLTYTRPKPLLPVLGRAMIDHIVGAMPKKVDRVILAVNYMADDIRAHLRTVDLGVEVVVVEEDEPLGTGGAFRNALDEVTSDTFIGFNADHISTLNMDEMLRYHEERNGIGTIALWQVPDPSRFGVVELDHEARIRSFIEKPAPGETPSDLINAGAYILRTEILELIEPGMKISIEREVFPHVLDVGLYGYRFSGFWVDAGTPEAFLEAHRELLDRLDPVTHYDVDAHPTATIATPSHLAPGCILDARAEVGPYATLGEGCHVGEGAGIVNCVLLPGARVERGARLYNSILGEGARVGEGEVLEGAVLEDGRVP
jgi:mannose-1-phosphate guanylyltransferase